MSQSSNGKMYRVYIPTLKGKSLEEIPEKQLNIMLMGALMSIRSFMSCPMKSLKWEEALDRATNNAMEITEEVRRRAEENE